MRIYVKSLGCKLNQAEMDDLAARLAWAGHQIVTAPAEADLSVLNTCAVTHVAAQKSRQALRRLHRDNPGARLVATGCYAELAAGELEGLPGVERVVGNAAKAELAALLGLATTPPPAGGVSAPATMARTRALIKIQDGCDNACTYCIIHVARGPQRSRPPDEVLAEVRARLAAGHQEIVLTGVHVGAYGRDRHPPGTPSLDLWGLVRRILNETDVPRLRLSSIEPWDLAPGGGADEAVAGAFALWQDPRLCRHLHLPLQSGDDRTLARMGRHYTTAEFAALVAAARAAIPDLAVTSDVIAGFPGETEADFEQSLAFLRDMALARVHVFPYSPRPGTPAAGMPDQVPAQVRAERARRLREAAAEGGRAFRRRFVGRRVEVLWESSRPGEGAPLWNGLTDHYLRVEAADPTGRNLRNTFGLVRIEGLSRGGLRGVIEDQKSGG